MLQNNYLASELLHECSICHEPVFNPLCPTCITEQINAWLTQYPNYHELRDHLLPKLHSFIKKSERNTTQCIKCKKARVSICPYCFTEHVLNELKTLGVHKIVLKEFLMFFNFDFEHKGNFTKEAEKMGVI